MSKAKDSIDICGILVQVSEKQAQQVEGKLNAIAGVEVHGLSEDLRLVVTIEQGSQGAIVETIDGINVMSGVVSTALVYQHSESC